MVEKRNDGRIAFISMGMVDGKTEKSPARSSIDADRIAM